DKYKVYNLCSKRLYDASLFEGKVASFPFDDHNCPPIQLIISFCHSAYSWLKEDIEKVEVVHHKAGMARTGLMITIGIDVVQILGASSKKPQLLQPHECAVFFGLSFESPFGGFPFHMKLVLHYLPELG
nr:phosphatidylinositol 3,4,5-trisphosphate 3-phosphatase and protein-tyrosine-phosphatase PTEN2A [Tanacetum cinerariifolium]